MNERIRELAKQAGDDWEHTLESDKQFLHKFAELIVLECIQVCKSRVGNSDYNTGRMHCVSDLREHFGEVGAGMGMGGCEMTALREAAQLALEALEWSWGGEPLGTKERDAIAALKAALAEPVQEPVAWWNGRETVWFEHELMGMNPPIENALPLYTAPTPRKPLTDEQIIGLWQYTKEPDGHRIERFARAIETAHGIKVEASK